MRPVGILALAIGAALTGSPGFAQQAAMPGMPPGQAMSGPAGQAMMDGMARMNQAMSSAPMTGDADHDFAAMMTPHHEGAIDMAEVELKYGKDPTMRRLARAIVAAQKKEIGELQRWRAAHP